LIHYLAVTRLSTETALTPTPRKRLTAEARREVIERAATELFAERGFHGASMEELAERSGVSVPVVYDHFESKRALHRHLLECHYAELRQVWSEHFVGDDPPETRVANAFDAWFAYVESHPYAWKMLFRDTTGEPEVQAFHREVEVESRAALMPLFAEEPGVENIAGSGDEALEIAWEAVRSLLQGLALWWFEHQHVPRAQVVASAMNALWVGFERVRRGEQWRPSSEVGAAGTPGTS
jgi:AcrR family transcriptional regulator